MSDDETLGTPEAAALLAAQHAEREAEAVARHKANWTPYVVLPEAAIGLMTCRRCGCCVILDNTMDAAAVHDDWHDQLAAQIARAGQETRTR